MGPRELAAEAARLGLRALAITDHDTLRGCDEAADAAREAGLDFIHGVEISTWLRLPGGRARASAHLLAYFPQTEPGASFRRWLQELHESRVARNLEMTGRLKALGVEVGVGDVVAAGGGVLGRPHFARALVSKGHAADIRDAFDRYLGEGAPAYVPRRAPWLPDAAERIVGSGGIPVLAHPVRLFRGHPGEAGQLLRMTAEQGVRGIEAWHSEHSEAEADFCRQLAERLGLLVTGGSDFHGDCKPGFQLGYVCGGKARVPDWVVDRLREAGGG